MYLYNSDTCQITFKAVGMTVNVSGWGITCCTKR